MPVDLLCLLRRDHDDLERELTQLLDPMATTEDLRTALDGIRLGLIAHAEAEDIVLGRFEGVAALRVPVEESRAAHRAQEIALGFLVSAIPQTSAWFQRAHHLRELVECHDRHEQRVLIPALRQHAPDHFAALAGAFATERMRQLSMMQPSAPIASFHDLMRAS